ncbi:MAG: DUF6603 domain-containing protein [Kofleriaceae bacterium]
MIVNEGGDAVTGDLVHRIVESASGAVLHLGQLLSRDHAVVAIAQRLGWPLDAVPPEITELAGSLRTIEPALEAMRADPDSPVAWTALMRAVADGAQALSALATVDFGAALDGLGFADEFPTQLLHWAAIEHLSRAHPRLLGVLRAAGIVIGRDVDPGASRVPYRDERFVLPAFAAMFESPSSLLRAAWAWGQPEFDGTRFLEEVGSAARAFGVTSGFQMVPASVPESSGQDVGSSRWHLINRLLVGGNTTGDYELGLRWLVFERGGLPALAIIPYVEGALAATVDFGELQLAVTGMATNGDQLALVITPTSIDLVDNFRGGGGTTPSAKLAIAFGPAPPVAPTTRSVGDAGELTTQGWQLKVEASTSPGGGDIALELGLPGATLALATRDSGLLSGAGADERARIPMPLSIGVSYRRGVFLGAGGLTSVPVPEISLGPVQLRDAKLSLASVGDGIAATLTTNAVIELGPVTITLFGIGAALTARFPGTGGNLGPLDVAAAAVAPSGGAVSVRTAILTGGGAIDRVAGRDYRGALAFDLLGVKLSALGLVDDTPESDGSFVAVVSAQFRPIPIGLGFKLSGVGGLVASHRRIDTDAMRRAFHGAGITDLFFASDPINQAARLLGDLAAYFPAAHGRSVIGPAVKLSWGPRKIVEAELALLLEMPAPTRLVVLGSIRTRLPRKDHPLVLLQVDAIGDLEITQRRLAIDATLRESHVVGFPIAGDFVLRAAWGERKALIISVGGFHSQFEPPPDLPRLQRVRIPIGADDDPRLELQGFLALTSNTAQVGAEIQLFASAGPLNIRGHLGFEALFQYSPFSFRVDLSAGVELRRGSTTLAGVQFHGTLSGPTPWRVSGEACLSLWFVDFCVPFSKTYGSESPAELPPTEIWSTVQPVLEDPASWATELPASTMRAVMSAVPLDATPAEAAAPRMDPAAALTVRQSIVPFDRRVTRFEQGIPSDVDELVITGATVGGGTASFTPVTDWFAPAQFEDLSDDDRLSRAGFELMHAGATLGIDAIANGSELVVPLEYETVTIAPSSPSAGERFRPSLFAQLLDGQRRTLERGPQLVARGGMPEEAFIIASVADLTAVDLVGAGARGVAELALAAHLAAHPEDIDALIVVPIYELAA